jgi:hypothetical protein
MSPTLTVILTAGIVVGGALILALIAWTIRVRRAEEGPRPPSTEWQKQTPAASARPGSADETQDWIQSLTREIPDPSVSSAGPPSAGETKTVFQTLFNSAMPELATLLELGKMVKESQTLGKTADTPEAKNEAFRRAAMRMLEEKPQNVFLQQLVNSMPSSGGASSAWEGDDHIQVYRIGGKTAIRVDGTEYSSPADIDDPEVRDKVRELIRRLFE